MKHIEKYCETEAKEWAKNALEYKNDSEKDFIANITDDFYSRIKEAFLKGYEKGEIDTVKINTRIEANDKLKKIINKGIDEWLSEIEKEKIKNEHE